MWTHRNFFCCQFIVTCLSFPSQHLYKCMQTDSASVSHLAFNAQKDQIESSCKIHFNTYKGYAESSHQSYQPVLNVIVYHQHLRVCRYLFLASNRVSTGTWLYLGSGHFLISMYFTTNNKFSHYKDTVTLFHLDKITHSVQDISHPHEIKTTVFILVCN